MEWLKQMQAALDYMEYHMDERLNIEQIAKVACSSTYHFQRMFHMVVGMTVGEYMRKRKLTLAAQELASSSAKVLDVAMKYGYDSPESFAKAFRKIHGISPSQARNVGVHLKAFPRISFQISLKGDQEMEYRIVEKESFNIAGKILNTTMDEGRNFREIPKFWDDCNQSGVVERILSYAEEEEMLGVIYDMELGKDTFRYMVGARIGAAEVPDDMSLITIPASQWAVFTSIGPMPGAIQSLTKRIYQEWFPSTGYEHAGTPELEVYSTGDIRSDDYRCEVWIPVR